MTRKFYTNDERLKHLQDLLLQDNAATAGKLAYEWVKVGIFGTKEFASFVKLCGKYVQDRG